MPLVGVRPCLVQQRPVPQMNAVEDNDRHNRSTPELGAIAGVSPHPRAPALLGHGNQRARNAAAVPTYGLPNTTR